jgi:hypothetical protein
MPVLTLEWGVKPFGPEVLLDRVLTVGGAAVGITHVDREPELVKARARQSCSTRPESVILSLLLSVRPHEAIHVPDHPGTLEGPAGLPT